jgi:hypothetical protein
LAPGDDTMMQHCLKGMALGFMLLAVQVPALLGN